MIILQVKDEAWWLVLGNTSTSQLHALKRVTFKDILQTNMEIPPNLNDFEVSFHHLFFLILLQSCSDGNMCV